MEENREPLSAIAIEKKLQLLRNKHFSEDTIALVTSDYEYGLTEEEISLYLNKSYDIEQMKILSECLHKDCLLYTSGKVKTWMEDLRMKSLP